MTEVSSNISKYKAALTHPLWHSWFKSYCGIQLDTGHTMGKYWN